MQSENANFSGKHPESGEIWRKNFTVQNKRYIDELQRPFFLKKKLSMGEKILLPECRFGIFAGVPNQP